MDQQELEYPEHQDRGAQDTETAYYRQQEQLMNAESVQKPYFEIDRHHAGGEKLPSQRSRRFSLWTPLVRFTLALFIGGALFGFGLAMFASSEHALSPGQLAFPRMGGSQNTSVSASDAPQQSFLVSGSVALSIHDLASTVIHIHTGDSGHVLVRETVLSGSAASIVPVQANQQGNALTLTIEGKGNTGMVLDVTTPLDTNLDVESETATIDFTGSFDPNNTYQFATKAGSISVSIPADSAFRLSNIVEIGDFTNEFGSDVAGKSPRATVALLAYNGSVSIQKS